MPPPVWGLDLERSKGRVNAAPQEVWLRGGHSGRTRQNPRRPIPGAPLAQAGNVKFQGIGIVESHRVVGERGRNILSASRVGGCGAGRSQELHDAAGSPPKTREDRTFPNRQGGEPFGEFLRRDGVLDPARLRRRCHGNFSTANNAGAPGDRVTSHPPTAAGVCAEQFTGAATENHPIQRQVG